MDISTQSIITTASPPARAQAPVSTLTYAVARSSLGWVLVAASERGIRAIELGSSSFSLIERLRVRFPAISLDDGDSEVAAWAAQVVEAIERPGAALDLPLDPAGTPFERRVWALLRTIPSGETVSYGAIAGRLGDGVTAWEVGQACAANQLAVAIPCHRVVRADGELAGYRWGIGRKRDLLRREAAAAR